MASPQSVRKESVRKEVAVGPRGSWWYLAVRVALYTLALRFKMETWDVDVNPARLDLGGELPLRTVLRQDPRGALHGLPCVPAVLDLYLGYVSGRPTQGLAGTFRRTSGAVPPHQGDQPQNWRKARGRRGHCRFEANSRLIPAGGRGLR